MKIISLSAALFAALFAASAGAQPMPPGPPGGVPPAEALATVPSLTAAQQVEVRNILIQRRDALEAAQTRARAEFDALRVKERNEHERVDAQTSEQLRKLLGDEGYRKYAEWDLAHRRPHDGGPGAHPPMPPRGEHEHGPERDAPPAPDVGGTHDAPPEPPKE